MISGLSSHSLMAPLKQEGKDLLHLLSRPFLLLFTIWQTPAMKDQLRLEGRKKKTVLISIKH